MGSGGPGGLPVPYIVISNKADIAAKEGVNGSSGNLVDVARQWVEKQGLLPASEELPVTDSFPGSGALLAVSSELVINKLVSSFTCYHIVCTYCLYDILVISNFIYIQVNCELQSQSLFFVNNSHQIIKVYTIQAK